MAARAGPEAARAADIVDRYLGDEAPDGMSTRTGLIRQAFQERRQQETTSWLKRTRHLRVAVGLLVVVSAGGGRCGRVAGATR